MFGLFLIVALAAPSFAQIAPTDFCYIDDSGMFVNCSPGFTCVSSDSGATSYCISDQALSSVSITGTISRDFTSTQTSTVTSTQTLRNPTSTSTSTSTATLTSTPTSTSTSTASPTSASTLASAPTSTSATSTSSGLVVISSPTSIITVTPTSTVLITSPSTGIPYPKTSSTGHITTRPVGTGTGTGAIPTTSLTPYSANNAVRYQLGDPAVAGLAVALGVLAALV